MNQLKRFRPGGGAHAQAVTSADIVAVGIKVTGVVQQVTATDGPAHDPVVRVIFVFSDGAGTSHRCESMCRVPDGKGHYLVPGNPIPVAFVPYDPTRATIDFARLV